MRGHKAKTKLNDLKTTGCSAAGALLWPWNVQNHNSL
nr:MAG TPA: hypothetical protein [Caudoviricetes sp.]